MNIDWSGCDLVEVIPGKVSGVPLLKNTRLPVEAITGNYDAFRDEGLPPESAIAETLDCYPEAGLARTVRLPCWSCPRSTGPWSCPMFTRFLRRWPGTSRKLRHALHKG